MMQLTIKLKIAGFHIEAVSASNSEWQQTLKQNKAIRLQVTEAWGLVEIEPN